MEENEVGKVSGQNREALTGNDTLLLFVPLPHLLAALESALADLFHGFDHALLFLLLQYAKQAKKFFLVLPSILCHFSGVVNAEIARKRKSPVGLVSAAGAPAYGIVLKQSALRPV
ncbi:MAG TPA: hypothetical protein VGF67_28175 [Ktedonobacteraceae bacterium]